MEKVFGNTGLSYETLAAVAKKVFGGYVDFDEKIVVDTVEMSHHDLILELVATAPVTDEAFELISYCMNPYISKCQNDVIDAAKNGAKVLVLFLKKFQTYFRSGAVSKFDWLKISLVKGGKLALNPIKLSVRGAKDEMKPGQRSMYSARPMRREYHKDPELGKYYVHVIEDLLTSCRNEAGVYAYRLLEEAMSQKVVNEMDTYTTKDPVLHENLKFLGSMYMNLMSAIYCNKKTAKQAVVSMARNLVRNYAYLDTKYMFREAYRASHYEADGEMQVNSFYLAFTSEALRHFLTKYCKDTKFRNRVYRFGNGLAYIGQKITFIDGLSDDKEFYTESKVNGTFALTIDGDGEAAIEMPLESMIPEVKYDDTAAAVELRIPKDQSWETLVDKISRARQNSKYTFNFRWVNDKTKAVVNDWHGASLWLCANDKPVAGVYDPKSGVSYIRRFLINRDFFVEQMERSVRIINGEEEMGLMLIGHVSADRHYQSTSSPATSFSNSALSETVSSNTSSTSSNAEASSSQ